MKYCFSSSLQFFMVNIFILKLRTLRFREVILPKAKGKVRLIPLQCQVTTLPTKHLTIIFKTKTFIGREKNQTRTYLLERRNVTQRPM